MTKFLDVDVYIENYRLQELDKALQSFTLIANITRSINP
jgi:hypothetical protein